MPSAILQQTAKSKPRRFTLRLSQDRWDALDAVHQAAAEQGMTLNLEAALSEYLDREIVKAERELQAVPHRTTQSATSDADDHHRDDGEAHHHY